MPKSLLLADDSITIQKVVQITFASEDFQITAVDNGDAALDKIRAAKPHIILADVVMPGKTGYDVCQTVKQDPNLQGVPVILLAGTFEPFDPERAKSVGADDFIVKPFETQALIDKVKRLVGMETGPQATAAAAAPKPQTGGFTAPSNPLFGKPASPLGGTAAANLTPMTAMPAQAKPATPPAPTPAAAGPGPLPGFGQQPPKPAQAVPPKDPFGMGPMFGGAKPATPAFPQAAAPAPAAAKPTTAAAHDAGLPEIDMGDVEPIETVKPTARPTTPPAAGVAAAVAPKVAAAADAQLAAAGLNGPLSDAVRETIERIVWEIVPELAETIIREELERLLRDKA